MIELCNN